MDVSPALPLRKFVAPEIVYGAGARKLAGRYARNVGAERVLVVSDPGVIAAGWTAHVLESLHDERVAARQFAAVSVNPRAIEVEEGARFYRDERCDAIVAVGGGSAVDCAKGIGIVVANGGRIVEFEGVDRIRDSIPPLICVPTTAGSAADLSQFAIITDLERRVKMAIVSKAIVPDVSLTDPDTTATLPRDVVACCGMDALVHGIEAFVSSCHSRLSDLTALDAVACVAANLPRAVREDAAGPARAEVMMGGLTAGLAFSNASLGAVHAMAHALGGLIDNPHGEANAMLVGPVIAFNYDAAPERFAELARRMGLRVGGTGPETRDALLSALERLRRDVGLGATLREKGVSRADIPELARAALRDPCIATNPRPLGQRDVERLYEEAF